MLTLFFITIPLMELGRYTSCLSQSSDPHVKPLSHHSLWFPRTSCCRAVILFILSDICIHICWPANTWLLDPNQGTDIWKLGNYFWNYCRHFLFLWESGLKTGSPLRTLVTFLRPKVIWLWAPRQSLLKQVVLASLTWYSSFATLIDGFIASPASFTHHN